MSESAAQAKWLMVVQVVEEEEALRTLPRRHFALAGPHQQVPGAQRSGRKVPFLPAVLQLSGASVQCCQDCVQ